MVVILINLNYNLMKNCLLKHISILLNSFWAKGKQQREKYLFHVNILDAKKLEEIMGICDT